MQEVAGAVAEYEPTVRYATFGGSGSSFNLGLRASDVSAQARIIYEFIKRQHSRYQREGIGNSSLRRRSRTPPRPRSSDPLVGSGYESLLITMGQSRYS